jgi:hypothetical protein
VIRKVLAILALVMCSAACSAGSPAVPPTIQADRASAPDIQSTVPNPNI